MVCRLFSLLNTSTKNLIQVELVLRPNSNSPPGPSAPPSLQKHDWCFKRGVRGDGKPVSLFRLGGKLSHIRLSLLHFAKSLEMSFNLEVWQNLILFWVKR